jgi:hypothetical protein
MSFYFGFVTQLQLSVELLLKISLFQSSPWNMRLNLNLVPVFQTMSDPGLGISALPRKPADVNNFVRWGQDTFLSYQDYKKYSLRSLVILGTESTECHLVFPASMKYSDGKNFPGNNSGSFYKGGPPQAKSTVS